MAIVGGIATGRALSSTGHAPVAPPSSTRLGYDVARHSGRGRGRGATAHGKSPAQETRATRTMSQLVMMHKGRDELLHGSKLITHTR